MGHLPHFFNCFASIEAAKHRAKSFFCVTCSASNLYFKKMTIDLRKLLGINAFILSSILIILIISIPVFAFLRVPFIIAHIMIFSLACVLYKQKIGINFAQNFIFALIFYVLIQNLYLGKSWIVVIQSIAMPILLLMTVQLAQINSLYFYESKDYKKLAKILFCLLPFFAVSLNVWSDTRSAGLFMNPNITAHMALMLSPFILLGLKTKKMKALLLLLVSLLIAITASRSGLLAFLLSVSSYIFVSYFKNIKFVFLTVLIAATTLISIYGVDIAVWLFSEVISKENSSSRLLYTGYNGRDILMDHALERFSSQPWFGLGFDGAKFELDGHELGTHNGMLDLLLRLGIIGTALFSLFSICLVYMASKANIAIKPVVVMSLVAIFSLSTNSSTFFVFNYLFLYAVILTYVGYINKKK